MNRNNSNMFVSCRPQWAFYFYFMVLLYFMWLTLRWAVEFMVDRSQHTVNTHADTHCHHPVLLAGGFRFSSLWSSAELWSSTAHRGQPAPFGSCRWLQRARYYSVSFRFTVWCCSVSADTFSHLPLHSHFHQEGNYRKTQQPTLRKRNERQAFHIKYKVEVQDSAAIWSNWQVSQRVVIMKFQVDPSWRSFLGSESIAASALWLMFAVWTRAASPQPEQMSKCLLDEIHSHQHWCCFLQNSWF